MDDQSRRHRSKSKNTDRDSTTPTNRRKRNNDSNATISNSKDSRPKNRPTSSVTEADVSRTVWVPVQESSSVERSTERSRRRNQSRSSFVSADESRPRRMRARSVSPEARRESSVAREPEHARAGPNVEGVGLHMHKDGDEPPQSARYVVESQLNSKARLVNLESEIRKATRGRKENDAKEYVSEKKLYKDQYDFNKNVFEHLDRALHLVFEEIECAAYQRDPFADNSSDEKRLKCARKEGKLAKEEKVKLANSKKSVKKPFLQLALTAGTGFLPSCWRCHRTGHIARLCKASIPRTI